MRTGFKQLFAGRRAGAPPAGEKGAILVIATIGITLAVVSAALAVDLGRQAQEARRNQKVADLAALDAVRVLPLDPTLMALQSAARNQFDYLAPGNSVVAEPGTVDAGNTFTPGLLLSANAVRVTVQSLLKDDFTPGDRTVIRRAVATLGNGNGCTLPNNCVQSDGNPLGSVRVGSTLAKSNGTVGNTEAEILNELLNETVGGSFELDTVGWKGIADANVTFGQLQSALGITAASADQVLATQVTYRQLLDATADALYADGSPSGATAATPVGTIAQQVAPSGGAAFSLDNLFNIQGSVGSGVDVFDATLNVKDIVMGGAILADGDHFASIDLTAADVGAIPGLNYARVKFGLIEAPVTQRGAPKDSNGVYRTIAKTSQVRVLLELHLKVATTVAGLVDVTVPYYLDAGSAEALLDTLHCTTGVSQPTTVNILGRTSAGSVSLGTVTNTGLARTTPVPTPDTPTLVNVAGLLRVNTKSVATTTVPGNAGQLLSFTPEYTDEAPSQKVSGTTLTLPSVTPDNLAVSGSADVILNGLVVASDIANGVNATLPAATTQILEPVYRALGLSFAGADVWAPPVQDCEPSSFTIDPPPVPFVRIPTLVG